MPPSPLIAGRSLPLDDTSISDSGISLLRTYASSPTKNLDIRCRVPAAAARALSHPPPDPVEAASVAQATAEALTALSSNGAAEIESDKDLEYLKPLLDVAAHACSDASHEANIFRAQVAAWKALSAVICGGSRGKPRSVPAEFDLSFRKQLLLAAGMATGQVMDDLLRNSAKVGNGNEDGDPEAEASFARQVKILRFHVANSARFSRSFMEQRTVLASSDACIAVVLRNLSAIISAGSLSAGKSLHEKAAKSIETLAILPATVAARSCLLMCGGGAEAAEALLAAYGVTKGGVSQTDIAGRLAAIAYFARLTESESAPTASSSIASSGSQQHSSLQELLVGTALPALLPLIFQLCRYMYISGFRGKTRGGNHTLAAVAASAAAASASALVSSTSTTDSDITALLSLLLRTAAGKDALASFAAQEALVAVVTSAPQLLAALMSLTRLALSAKSSCAETTWLPVVTRASSLLAATSDGVQVAASVLFPASLTPCSDPLADIAGLHVLAQMYSSSDCANSAKRVLSAAGATCDMLSSFCKQTLLGGQACARLAEPCALLLGYVTPARAAGGAALACVKRSSSSTAVVAGVLRGLLTNVESLPAEPLLRTLTAELPRALERHGPQLAPAVAALCNRIADATSAGHVGGNVGTATRPVLVLCARMTSDGEAWPAGAAVSRWAGPSAELGEAGDDHTACTIEERRMRSENRPGEVGDIGPALAALARAVACSGNSSSSGALKGEVTSLALLAPALAALYKDPSVR